LRAGQIELNFEPVDLSDIVNQVVDRLRDQLDWSRSPCTVHKSGPTDGKWDKLRLEIVISNLLSNALKYGAARPIHIELDGNETGVLVAVSDEGRGIADADLPRLFRPFERIARGSGISGFGLGLWTVKHLVEAQGGAVAVKSALGAG